ncbi:protocadherin-like wing polarity protein stan, partial [Acropora millepora]|uniref:protocadherin-like wing polarity protein stan n=1 Tax=Acropora millepora TaxID=45264 RepID=UPI001CF25CBA
MLVWCSIRRQMFQTKNFIGSLWILLLSFQRLEAQAPNERPVFSMNQFTAVFYEEQPIGTKVIQVSANDNEKDEILYEIGSDAEGKFNIDRTTGWITSNETIDRETAEAQSIKFTVYAYDSVNGPSAKVSAEVLVTISDVNDNPPIFKKSFYQKSTSEDASLTSEVITVTATDADSPGSSNSLITYTIADGNVGNKFFIGFYSGTVTVIRSLDFESVNNYTLKIIAKDGGPNNGLNSSTTLKILVQDADDLPAVFSPSSYSAEVPENAAKGKYVTTVTASDGDKMLNAPVNYLIDADTNPGYAFGILGNSGVITVNGSLDRETKGSYLLRVGATSTTHNAVFTTVSITVTDTNDNRPSFVDTPYTGEVLENAALGMTVMRVTATDNDEGNNAVFSYSLERAAGKFTVTPEGHILVNDAIDRETQDSYSFQVVAKETRTLEQFQAVAPVKINVTDVNDNNPRCTQAVYKRTVYENRPSNSFVIQVSASDPDLGSSGLVRYDLVPDSSGHGKSFSINPLNGTILTNATFDRERLGLYTITVRATDKPTSGQERFGECKVQVTVGDDNDNSPKFTNLPNDTTVSEGRAANTVFFTVKAVDADEGLNAAVSYSLSSGNTGVAFSLDTT